MCWYINFNIELQKKSDEVTKKIETIIQDFRIKPDKRGMREVTLAKGSVEDGYRTALHCDCDNVKANKDGSKVQILHYPELFKQIIAQDRVKNIQVHWFWSKDEPKQKEEKITISEFLKKNQASELSTNVSYKILKEKYY